MATMTVDAPGLPPVLQETRPWGGFRRLAHNEDCTVKIITVDPYQRLSLQRHTYRDELWVILDPGINVQIDGVTHAAAPGDEFFVPRQALHRLSSVGPRARVLEVAFGRFDENDIERLDDEYGRSAIPRDPAP